MAVVLSDQAYNHEDQPVPPVDKRRHARFITRLKALFYVADEHEGLEKCEIVDVSYGGLGIRFNQAAAFEDSSAINLGIVVKWQVVPISLKGKVKWLSKNLKQPLGGVELDGALDNMTLLKLL